MVSTTRFFRKLRSSWMIYYDTALLSSTFSIVQHVSYIAYQVRRNNHHQTLLQSWRYDTFYTPTASDCSIVVCSEYIPLHKSNFTQSNNIEGRINIIIYWVGTYPCHRLDTIKNNYGWSPPIDKVAPDVHQQIYLCK